jgi:hypothetical protein
MLVTVTALEVLLGKYWGDLEDAKLDPKKLRKFAAKDGVPWTLSHCFFANMGYNAIVGCHGATPERTASSSPGHAGTVTPAMSSPEASAARNWK